MWRKVICRGSATATALTAAPALSPAAFSEPSPVGFAAGCSRRFLRTAERCATRSILAFFRSRPHPVFFCGQGSREPSTPGHHRWEEPGGTRDLAVESGASAQKGTRPSAGPGPLASALVSMLSVITADTPVEANCVHSTASSPGLARTIVAGSSRCCMPKVGASVSIMMVAAGQMPSSVLIKAPLALTSSSRPRHLHPLSGDCRHRSRTGIWLMSLRPQRCSICVLPGFFTL